MLWEWGDYTKAAPGDVSIRNRGHQVSIFCSQLSAMITSGVPLLRALEVLAEQAEDDRLGFVLDQVQRRIASGYTFSKALSLYSKIFPPVFFHLVSAGESTGRLAKVLERLADLLEKEDNLVRSIRGALSYPVFVLALTFVLTIGLFTTVLPSFADFYKDFEIELPVVTQSIITLTHWCRSPWFWIAMCLLFGGLAWALRRSWYIPEHKILMYRFFSHVPFLGDLLLIGGLARYCWVLDLTLAAGIGVIRGLRLAALSSSHPVVEYDSSRLVKGITDGETLSELMSFRPELYPTLLLQMVRLGEETSTIGDTCGRMGEWFEEDVEYKIMAFRAALEPIMMTVVSSIVGTIVIAVFLPLYGLLEKLGAS